MEHLQETIEAITEAARVITIAALDTLEQVLTDVTATVQDHMSKDLRRETITILLRPQDHLREAARQVQAKQ